MKKSVLVFVLGILMLSLVLVQAEGNNSDMNNTDDGSNQTDTGTNQTDSDEQNDTDTDTNETDDDSSTTVTKTKTRLKDRNLTREQIREIKRSMTFVPWQKRNESECAEGCKCRGAVVSCLTENGKEMTITAGRSGNVIVITIEKTNVSTELEIEQESDEQNKSRLRAKLKNGEKRLIKIMPDVASQKILKRLRLKKCLEEDGCNFELKEVGEGEKAKLAYEVKAKRRARLFWLFGLRMNVQSQVDAETGEIIKFKKPWWAFLAYEPEE